MTEAKSSSVSLDVFTTKFRNCRYVYPHRIVHPLNKDFVDHQEQLNKFLSDLRDNSITLSAFIGDNPKRSDLRCCLNHAALFACEYCFAKGVRITAKKGKELDSTRTKIIDKIKRIKKEVKSDNTSEVLTKIITELEEGNVGKRQITVWPSSTANKEPRTKEKILDILELINEHENTEYTDPLTKDDVKGIKGRSLLLDWDSFDFVIQLPTEYMHLVCLGVTKRLTELTFNVGTNRTRITNRKLSSTKDFNYLMSLTKVVFEFSRRSRDLDFAVYKAEEFRNLALFFFPHVLECLEPNAKERELWLYLAFMIRACILPDKEFFNVNVSQITAACHKFYKLFESLFGASNCTYSIHVLCCHLLQIRQLGPLTESSAFKFESFYGELRNSFTPGTPATLKQMFENVLLKRSLAHHSCEKSIELSNYETSQQCNSLVYTFTDDRVQMYKIVDLVDETVVCNPQGKFNCTFKNVRDLSWSSVGVFQKGPISKEIVKVPQHMIAGKVLKVGSYLITCPDNVLKEK